MKRYLLVLLLAFVASIASAETMVRPFVAGSLAQIQAARQGKPFVLAFWSISCTHCPAELKTLGELKRRHPELDDAAQTALLAKSYGLGKVEQWVFADSMPERLRFEIDRRWYGELPRTQFYDRRHKVEAVSGVVPEERLLRWVRETL
jgi:thiol-disulfide isomerase/thioredoxin